MASVVEFFVPGPPPSYVRMTSRSKWGERAQRYFTRRDAVALAAKAEGAELLAGPVGLVIRLYVRDVLKRRFDADNCAKGVADALQGVCFANDKQIVLLSVRVLPCDGREPGTLVVVGPSEEVEWQR